MTRFQFRNLILRVAFSVALVLGARTPRAHASIAPLCLSGYTLLGTADILKTFKGYDESALQFLRALELRSDVLAKLLSQSAGKISAEEFTQLRSIQNLNQRYQSEVAPKVSRYLQNERDRVSANWTPELLDLLEEEQIGLAAEIRSGLLAMKSTLSKVVRPHGDEAIIEIGTSTAGNLGDETRFVERLTQMYAKVADKKKFRISILNESEVDGQVRSRTLKIEGVDAFSLLSVEGGDHRLIEYGTGSRLGGKKVTNYASVSVYRPPQVYEFKVDSAEFKVTSIKASGPGGQHVNKTESAVYVVHQPTGIAIKVAGERSQDQNKKNAIEILTAILFKRHQEAQETRLKAARQSGKENPPSASSTARWTRTYDFSLDRNAATQAINGNIEQELSERHELALIQALNELRMKIESEGLARGR